MRCGLHVATSFKFSSVLEPERTRPHRSPQRNTPGSPRRCRCQWHGPWRGRNAASRLLFRRQAALSASGAALRQTASRYVASGTLSGGTPRSAVSVRRLTGELYLGLAITSLYRAGRAGAHMLRAFMTRDCALRRLPSKLRVGPFGSTWFGPMDGWYIASSEAAHSSARLSIVQMFGVAAHSALISSCEPDIGRPVWHRCGTAGIVVE